MSNWKKILSVSLAAVMAAGTMAGVTGCGKQAETEETIVLRILENDTAKKEGYLDALINAFNEAYKDKGIQAVDANMDEYSNLAENGPYGYGPDVIYQANDKLMTYAEDKHILPLDIESFECYEYIPQEAVLGVVKEIYGKRKTVKVTDKGYLRYVKVWMKLYPIRRLGMRLRGILQRVYHKLRKKEIN